MMEIDPNLIPDQGIENSLPNWAINDSRAVTEADPSPESPAHPITEVIQVIAPPPTQETLTQIPLLKEALTKSLLGAEKLSYADIAAGRRSPSVSRQGTIELAPESVPTVDTNAGSDTAGSVQPVAKHLKLEIQEAAPVTEKQEEPITSPEPSRSPGRSRWEKSQEKVIQSPDGLKETAAGVTALRRETRRRMVGTPQRGTPERISSSPSTSREARPRPAAAAAVAASAAALQAIQRDSSSSPETVQSVVPSQPTIDEVKEDEQQVQQALQVHQPLLQSDAAPSSVVSPSHELSAESPSSLEKPSRSPMWMAGSGQPSYADILRGHFIPHQRRGMAGVIFDAPTSNMNTQEEKPGEEDLSESAPSEPMEELDNIASEGTQAASSGTEVDWNPPAETAESVPPCKSVATVNAEETMAEQPSLHEYHEPSAPMFQHTTFDSPYAVPLPVAGYPQGFDMINLRSSYTHLEYAIPVESRLGFVEVPLVAYPVVLATTEPVVVPFSHQLEEIPAVSYQEPIEQENQVSEEVHADQAAPQDWTTAEPTVDLEEPTALPPATISVAEPDVETVAKPATSTTKLSYAQILSFGLVQSPPALQEPQRDSSASASQRSSSNHSVIAVAPTPVAAPVPAPPEQSRAGSEPREPRSRQRSLKAMKAKSFDARDKVGPPSHKSSGTSRSGKGTLSATPSFDEARRPTTPRQKKRKSAKASISRTNSEFSDGSMSGEREATPVNVTDPEVQVTAPQENTTSSTTNITSEPEMNKAMLAFYGITTEDIEQFVSSRSQDSDSENEVVAAAIPATAPEAKKKHRKSKRKSLSATLKEEDEIEKALREISELGKSKRSRLKKEPSSESVRSQKSSRQSVPRANTESSEAKTGKKLKKAASMNVADDPITPSLLHPQSEVTSESASGSASEGSKHRRNRMKKAKSVSFNQDPNLTNEVAEETPVSKTIDVSVTAIETMKPVVESAELPVSQETEKDTDVDVEVQLMLTSTEPAPTEVEINPVDEAKTMGKEAESLVLEKQEEIDNEKTSIDTMSDIVVLETEMATPMEIAHIFEDVITERAQSFERSPSIDTIVESDCSEIQSVAEEVGKEAAPSKPMELLEQKCTELASTVNMEATITEEVVELDQEEEKIPIEIEHGKPVEIPVVDESTETIGTTSDIEPIEPEEPKPLVVEAALEVDALIVEDLVDLVQSEKQELIQTEPVKQQETQAVEEARETTQEDEQTLSGMEPMASVQLEPRAIAVAAQPVIETIGESFSSATSMAEMVQGEQVVIEYEQLQRVSVDQEINEINKEVEQISAGMDRLETEEPKSLEELVTSEIYIPVVEGAVQMVENNSDTPATPVQEIHKTITDSEPEETVEQNPSQVASTSLGDVTMVEVAQTTEPAPVPIEVILDDSSTSAINTGTTEMDASVPTQDKVVDTSEAILHDSSNNNVVMESSNMVEAPMEQKRSVSPYGFEDADHVVLSPQWMRQRPPLARTFSLDSKSTVAQKATPARMEMSSQPELNELPSGDRLQEPKATLSKAKSMDDASRESQTGGEADDEEVEVYWRLLEKKKKKKRRGLPQTTTALSLDSSTASLGSASPSNTPSVTGTESVITSEEDNRDQPKNKDDQAPKSPTQMPTPDSDMSYSDLGASELCESSATPTPGSPSDFVMVPSTAEMESGDELCVCDTPTDVSLTTTVAIEENKTESVIVAFSERIETENDLVPEQKEIPTDTPACDLLNNLALDSWPKNALPSIQDSESQYWASQSQNHPEANASVEEISIPRSSLTWANVVATAKPRSPEPVEEAVEDTPRPARPQPTLVVVGELEEVPSAPVKLDAFDEWVGRRERRRRKWRSSQSGSHDYSSEDEHQSEGQVKMESMIVTALPETVPEQEAATIHVEKAPESQPAEVKIASEIPEKSSETKDEHVLCEEDDDDFPAMESLIDDVLPVVDIATATAEKGTENTLLEEDDDFPPMESLVEESSINIKAEELVLHQKEMPRDTPINDLLTNISLDSWPKSSLPSIQDCESQYWALQSKSQAGSEGNPVSKPSLTWANVVATAKPRSPEPVEEVEDTPRPARPQPTLVVVGEFEEVAAVPSDPDYFDEWVGRRERRRRKWRSSQSESHDYSNDEEQPNEEQPDLEKPSENPKFDEQPSEDMAPVAMAAVQVAETVVEIAISSTLGSNEQDEQVVLSPLHKEKKINRSSFPVKEVEQRRKRSRLSESEKEALDLADAIERGDPIVTDAKMKVVPVLFHNLFADSWPDPFYFFIRDAESRWRSSESALAALEPEPELSSPGELEPIEVVESNASAAQSEEEQPLTWAALVATHKYDERVTSEVSETDDMFKSIPLRPVKTPLLVVVGEEASVDSPTVDDPDAFLECVGRRERRRRKWRSSQSESQDAGTDGDENVELMQENPTEEESVPSAPKARPELASEPRGHVTFSDDVAVDDEVVIAVKAKTKVSKVAKELKDVERKRQRSRLSESEKEALELAEAIEHGPVLKEVAVPALSDSYWSDRLVYSDAETSWQESRVVKEKSNTKTIEDHPSGPSQDPDGDPSPQPPSSSGGSGGDPGSRGGFPAAANSMSTADLPSGVANWSDESTYLADEPLELVTTPTPYNKVGSWRLHLMSALSFTLVCLPI